MESSPSHPHAAPGPSLSNPDRPRSNPNPAPQSIDRLDPIDRSTSLGWHPRHLPWPSLYTYIHIQQSRSLHDYAPWPWLLERKTPVKSMGVVVVGNGMEACQSSRVDRLIKCNGPSTQTSPQRPFAGSGGHRHRLRRATDSGAPSIPGSDKPAADRFALDSGRTGRASASVWLCGCGHDTHAGGEKKERPASRAP